MDTLQHLRESNPGIGWDRHRFGVPLRLADGRLIVLRFDARSADVNLAAEGVLDGYHPRLILEITAEATKAMRKFRRKVMRQIELSFIILDAISANDFNIARDAWAELLQSVNNLVALKYWDPWLILTGREIERLGGR